MRHKGIFGMLYGVLAAGLLALGGCNPSAVDEPAGTDSSCRVAFRLGGAAGNASSRMAEGESASGGELQTNLEKQVNSLLAVIFTDADPLGDTEDNANDKFFRTVKIDLGDETIPVIDNLSFLVGDEGDYIVIFVANVDEEKDKALADALAGLKKGVTTVGEFKNLEVSQAPETKPGMLMTSGFIRFRSSLVEAVDLGTVYLRRIMSRIDLINMADGVTVTRAVLHNRTVKSLLCNDATLEVNPAYIETPAEKSYDELNLVGSMDNPTKYEAEIYSYEQLADNTQGTLQPSVDVYYTRSDKGEQLFKHTVSLKVADGAALVPIGLKRNNAYLVYIRADAGELLFSVKVEDWVEGETFTVTDGELSEGAFGIPTAPGTVTGSWTNEGTESVTAD